MKKRITAHVMILLMMFSMLGGMLLSAGASVGSVTHLREMTAKSPKGTYYVETEADLSYLATLVNSGMTMEGYTFLQTADITLTAENFTPIGLFDDGKYFRGTYDGQRHTISNLQIYDADLNGAGLFGYAYYATLKNIGIESGSVTSANRAGGVAGYADGCTVINCYNKATITILTGTDGVGGIAGVARNHAYIYGCYNAGTVTCATNGAGGIVGWAGQAENSMLIGCYNAGKLAHSVTLSGSRPLDVIARSSRTVGDFSSCYYLAGIYGTDIDTYNPHNAQKLTTADNLKMAYVLNHATGANTNAFTVDKSGAIVFAAETEGVTDLRIKAMRGDVLLEDTGINRVTTGGYTIPATYASYEVLGATVGKTSYKVGDFIPADTADVLTVTLTLAGEFPSIADYAENAGSAAYTVSTATELAKLAELVDAGNTFANKTVYVTADLDFADYPTWNGIGYATGSANGVVAAGSLPFSGTFDGQFHHFKNINFKNDTRYTAIFSHTEGATLRNIIFDEGTIHVSTKNGRNAGVLVGVLSNTTVMNMENHVSVYADQVNIDSDNLGFVAMSTNNSVIKNVVSYGEIGLKDKTAISQQDGGLVGWGYWMTSVDNCIVVGEVYGSTYDPIARGCTITNSYYLPHREVAGTMTYETLLSGEAAWKLNQTAGTNLWGNGEEGPALDPDHPIFPVHYTLNDADAALATADPLISGTVTEYHVAGEQVTLPAQAGYTMLLDNSKYWPLTDVYTMPCFEQTISLWYSHKAYDITYVTNGGAFTIDPTVTAISGIVQELPTERTLERSGYFFTGWYDNEQLTGDPVTATPVDLYHDVTYYAGWAEVEKISTAAQLAAIDLDGHYILTADIDLSGVNFTPIGSYDTPFTGCFDGDGYTVSGLNISSTAEYQGLFAVNAGIIRNVVLANSAITGNAYVGGIAGENLGTIENCISSADVTATGNKTAMSFDLLVQNLKVGPDANRLANMKKRFDAYDADIMLLQEASTPWIEFLNTNYVSTGEYTMFYKYRYELSDGDAAFNKKYPTPSHESTPVLYKPEKFNLIDTGYFWLSETPNTVSRPEGATHFRICSWAVLEEKTSGRYVAVFSVHLDIGGDEVRAINAQAIMNKANELRTKYASKDLMMVIAGDYNARIDSKGYNTVFTGDIVNAVYEITQTITPATIDHVGLSENNIRAVDGTFKYLWGEYEVEPSDHKGIYVELEALVNTYQGGITGSNSGTVRNSVATGTVSGTTACGSLIGRNIGTVDGLYYTGTNPFGLTKEGYSATAMTSDAATAYALNANGANFTLTDGAIDLLHNGMENVCLTESGINESHQYGKSKTVAPTCTEVGYTAKTCATCGYQYRTATVAAAGHQYGAVTAGDALYHQQSCAVCGDIEYVGHTYTASYVEATCGAYGAEHNTCDCGYSYDVVDDDSKSHIWSGYAELDETDHLQTCSRDDTHTLQRAHTFTATPVGATCEAAGGNTYTCTGCAYNYFSAEGEPKGHQYGAWAELDAEKHQAVCEHDTSHVTTAPHGMDAGVFTQPTCEEQGYTVYTCEDCGYTENRDYVDAKGHTYTYDAEAKAYSCHCGEVYEPTGDVNGDGKADSADAILILRRIAGWKGEIPDHAADINCDGKLKIYDAVLFLQTLINK